MYRQILLSLSLVVITSIPASSDDNVKAPPFDGNRAKQNVAHLASDAMRGRMTCTAEFRQAADWSAAQFRTWGLKPAGEDHTYFQKVTIRDFTTREGGPQLTVHDRRFLFDDDDYSIVDPSTAGATVQGEVVFVGYGISNPKKGLDEYKGLDVKDKVVLVFKGSPTSAPEARGMFTRPSTATPAPEEKEPADPWKDEATDAVKIRTAYDHGAAAILLFDADQGEETLPRRRSSRSRQPKSFEPKRPFLTVTINERIFRAIMKQSPQESPRGVLRRMDAARRAIKEKKSQSRGMGLAVKLKGYDKVTRHDAEHKNNLARNVLAKLEGTDPKLKDQIVLVGAHLDHIGVRDGYINNGADDNASGSAVVLETARVLATSGFKPRRTLVFALWCGEELGLIGSLHYTKAPCDGVAMDRVVTSFNLDMVGMGATLGASGALNFPSIWKVIQRDQDPAIMKSIEPSVGGPGGSDHSGFITQGIETIFLMSRGGKGHQDYHQPEDDTEKIEPEMLRQSGQFVVQGMMNVANETKTDLLVPRRLERYRGLRMRIAVLNPKLPGSTWSQVKIEGKTPEAIFGEIRSHMLELLQTTPIESPRRGRATAPTAAPKKSITRGITAIDRIASDPRLLDLVIDLYGIGRVDIAKDQPGWVAEGRLTDAAKEGLKQVEQRDLLLRLDSPSETLVEDVLAATKKPFVITGSYAIPESLVDQINARQIQLGVNLDPNTIGAFIARVEQLKSRLGQRQNLFAYVTSSEGLEDTKPALYLGLLDHGWARTEISGGREHRGLMGGAAITSIGK